MKTLVMRRYPVSSGQRSKGIVGIFILITVLFIIFLIFAFYTVSSLKGSDRISE